MLTSANPSREVIALQTRSGSASPCKTCLPCSKLTGIMMNDVVLRALLETPDNVCATNQHKFIANQKAEPSSRLDGILAINKT